MTAARGQRPAGVRVRRRRSARRPCWPPRAARRGDRRGARRGDDAEQSGRRPVPDPHRRGVDRRRGPAQRAERGVGARRSAPRAPAWSWRSPSPRAAPSRSSASSFWPALAATGLGLWVAAGGPRPLRVGHRALRAAARRGLRHPHAARRQRGAARRAARRPARGRAAVDARRPRLLAVLAVPLALLGDVRARARLGERGGRPVAARVVLRTAARRARAPAAEHARRGWRSRSRPTTGSRYRMAPHVFARARLGAPARPEATTRSSTTAGTR